MRLSFATENDMLGSRALTVLRSLRIPFLSLTVVSIALAWAAASYTHSSNRLDMLNLFLALLGATTAHASVNWINEYIDFRSGLDRHTARTPFSGGSGALLTAPRVLSTVLVAGLVALAITLAIGFSLLARSGAGVLPIGIAGVLIVVSYSNWIVRHPFACLAAPGIGMGPLMVVGTYRVVTGEFATLPLWASLVPLFLTNNLLLLNQFPDRTVDARFGRRHFPIAFGTTTSVAVYTLFVISSVAVIVGGVGAEIFPPLCLMALLPVSAGIVAAIGATKYKDDTNQLVPYLALNALTAVLTPLIFALALFVS